MKNIAAIFLAILLSACASTIRQQGETRDVAVFKRDELRQAVKAKQHTFRWENGEKELSRDEMRSLLDAMDRARRAKGGEIRQREGKALLTCQSDRCTLSTVL